MIRETKRRKDRQQVFSMTVTLGILSHATALHRYTLLHVCSAPAGVCWCFTGGFLFSSPGVIRPAALWSWLVVFLNGH